MLSVNQKKGNRMAKSKDEAYIIVDKETHKEFKMEAVKSGRTMRGLVKYLLEEYKKKQK